MICKYECGDDAGIMENRKKHFFGSDERTKRCIVLYGGSAHGVPPEGYGSVAGLADAHVWGACGQPYGLKSHKSHQGSDMTVLYGHIGKTK